MDAHQRDKRRQQFEALCRAEGLPLTVQRRIILDVVLERGEHPTVDDVLLIARRRLPGVSRATIHRTLETFVRLGLLAKAGVPGRAARYDARLDAHHHLVCSACEAVIDIVDPALDALPMPDASRLGFEVSDFVVQFRGLCQACRAPQSGRRRPSDQARPTSKQASKKRR